MVEAGFVRRFAGPQKLEIKKPITKAKEWFGRKFLELTNVLPEIHKDHSGRITQEEYKRLNEIAQESKKMSELRIRIPTIQIVVQDEWNGLYD